MLLRVNAEPGKVQQEVHNADKSAGAFRIYPLITWQTKFMEYIVCEKSLAYLMHKMMYNYLVVCERC